MSISPLSNLRSPIHSKVSYTTTMVRGDKVHLPPQLSGFKVGQRVFFAMRDGEIRIHPKPVRVVGGRLLSSRVRHAVLPKEAPQMHSRTSQNRSQGTNTAENGLSV